MKNKSISNSNTMLNETEPNNFINHEEELLASVKIYLEGIENLKKEITNLNNNFDSSDIEHKIPVIVLETIPLDDLEILVENLQAKTSELVNFLNLEEKELVSQKKLVKEIEKKLAQAKESDKLSLKKELVEAQEITKLLDKTLIGQRRNLKKQQEILNQHLKILNRRKSISDLKSFDTINLDPVLKDNPQEDLIKKIEAKLAQTNLDNITDKTQTQKQNLDFDHFRKPLAPEAKENKKPGKLKFKWILISSISLLTITLGYIFYLITKSQVVLDPSKEVISEQTKQESVAAIGYIEPKGGAIKVSASASLEGVRVERVLVELGDQVKVGQAIALLDSHERLQASLEQAQNEVRLAQAKLAQIKAGAKPGEVKAQDAEFQRIQAELVGQIASQKAIINELKVRLEGEQQRQKATIRRIKAELNHSQGECQQHQILFDNGAVSEQKLNQICLQQETNTENLQEAEVHLVQTVSSLEAQISEANANLERIATTLIQQVNAEQATLQAIEEVPLVDIQVAQAELEGAKAIVKKAEAELKLAYIRAPIDGQILKIYTRPGEVLSEKGIVEMGQTYQMYVRAEVYETDISRVQIGQKATIKGDEIIQDLKGTVEEIGLKIGRRDIFDTDPVAQADARVVEVKISLSPENSEKIARLTNLQVNVIIDTSSSQR